MTARAARLAALVVIALLGGAIVLWPDAGPTGPARPGDEIEPVATGERDHAPPTPIEVGTPERIAAATNGAFRGRVTDLLGQGLVGARVQRIDGEHVVAETACGGDGAFLLGGVPAGRWSLRALADGFAPAQRGDLDAGLAGDRVLDVGDLPLRPATAYRGRVLARGVALAGAKVVVRTELRAEDTTAPLVRTVDTADDGWFFVADAAPPPVFVEALATGHRPQQQRIVDATAELRFDLQPFPIVHGRVVSAATSAPLPSAHVLLLELQPGQELPATPLPDFDPLPPHRVGSDGTFTRAFQRTPWALAARAEGHVAQLLGPFTHADAARDHTIVMQPGASLRCRVTGVPANELVQFDLRRDVTSAPLVRHSAPAQGSLLLPPVPPGRWLLRVDGEHAARHEQWLDLATATVHDVDVVLHEGTRLRGHLRGGPTTGRHVVCQHDDGTQRTGSIDGDGAFAVRGLFAGRWRVLVIERSDDFVGQRRNLLMHRCAGTPLEVAAGETERSLDPIAPEAAFGRVRVVVVDPTVDRIRLLGAPVDPTGRPCRVPPGLLESGLRDEARAFWLDPVLPGAWRLQVLAGERLVHQQEIVVPAGAWTGFTVPQ